MILAPRLTLCLLAAGLCIFQAQGMTVLTDCCLATRESPAALNWLPFFRDYEFQGTERGCSIKAFVVITKAGRQLCLPPDSLVTKKLQKALDEKKAENKKKPLLWRKRSS